SPCSLPLLSPWAPRLRGDMSVPKNRGAAARHTRPPGIRGGSGCGAGTTSPPPFDGLELAEVATRLRGHTLLMAIPSLEMRQTVYSEFSAVSRVLALTRKLNILVIASTRLTLELDRERVQEGICIVGGFAASAYSRTILEVRPLTELSRSIRVMKHQNPSLTGKEIELRASDLSIFQGAVVDGCL
ncbi:MAG: hypothetical protein QW692_02175, partial [Nitrososphaerota archaeon]